MPEISLKAETLFHIGQFQITNSLFLSVLVLLILAIGSYVLRRKIVLVPRGFQNLAEIFTEGALSIMDSVLIKRRRSEKYLPLVGTIFFFILISNWFGLFPGIGSIVVHEGHGTVPLLRAPASDLNFTLALAIIAVFTVNVFGSIAVGVGPHLSRFFNFKNPLTFFIGILEFISEIAKIISFSFRLFGNVFAGEVLLTIATFLVPYAIPVPFLFMELFVGFIQAFVFAMLSLVFVEIATTEPEGH